MRCQHFITEDAQCGNDATRRVIVRWDDPPSPGQQGYVGTIYMVQVCDEHDPNPGLSMPLPRPPTSTPIGERPRL
jgi:hypothetical protein